MNLLFQAIAILIILLPGILFRSAYNKGNWNYPLGRLGPISEQVPRALLYAFCLNAAWAYLICGVAFLFPGWVWPINLTAVIYWLSFNFGKDQIHFDSAVRALTVAPLRVSLYFVGLYVSSWAAGYWGHRLIRARNLDRRFPLLRFDNDWHYLLKGGVLGFPEAEYNGGGEYGLARPGPAEYGGTAIAAIVDTKDKSFLYVGALVDFFFNSSGDLDRLLLEGVMRREIGEDRPNQLGLVTANEEHETIRDYLDKKGYHIIKGHFFVLRMSEIKTLNVLYLTKRDASDAVREAETLAD